VAVTRCDDEILELRCRDDPNGERQLYWRMPIHEAGDLARWWNTESSDVKDGRTSLPAKRVGSLLISMFAPTMIHVRALDADGRIQIVGYSFPRELVEYLAGWVQSIQDD
jgi:hypothetical protein